MGVLVWVQLGSQLVKIAASTLADVRAALEARGIAVDDAALDAMIADYDARIARAQLAAGATND
jgi:hypothetical protein